MNIFKAKGSPQLPKHTMADLFQCYQVNPHAQYGMVADAGCIYTLIDQYCQESQSEEWSEDNCEQESQEYVQQKGVGLFSNIIRNIETRKNQMKEQEYQAVAARVQPIREYKFYFNNLKNKDTDIIYNRSNQTGNKRNPSGNIHDEYFSGIELKEEQLKQQISAEVQSFKKQQELRRSEKGEMINQLIDLNFSFDEISQQVQDKSESKENIRHEQRIELKKQQQPRLQSGIKINHQGKESLREQSSIRQEEDTIVHRYLKEPDEECEIKQINVRESKNKLIIDQHIPLICSRQPIKHSNQLEVGSQKGNQLKMFSPNLQIKNSCLHSGQTGKKSNDLLIEGNNQLNEGNIIVGTKKTESRIYTVDYRKQIQIDFDLDLNFI